MQQEEDLRHLFPTTYLLGKMVVCGSCCQVHAGTAGQSFTFAAVQTSQPARVEVQTFRRRWNRRITSTLNLVYEGEGAKLGDSIREWRDREGGGVSRLMTRPSGRN